jgi:hypothetical protein
MTFQQLIWTLSLLDNPLSHIHRPEFHHMKKQMVQTVQNAFPEDIYEDVSYDINLPDTPLMS